MDRLTISSGLVQAYAINLGKIFIFLAALAAAYFAVLHFMGTDPFTQVFEDAGLPIIWVSRGIIAGIAILLVLAIFDTLSLTSYSLVFQGDTLSYSYGSFIKVTKSTPISNIIRVNFREYAPLKIGDLIVELTGTEEKNIKVQYVTDVKSNCELVNKLVKLKESEEDEEIREKGVL
jgi:hypothetical protein